MPRHFKLTWGGTLYSDEVWAMGALFGREASDGDSAVTQLSMSEAAGVTFCQDHVAAIGGAVNSWWTSASMGNSQAKLTWAKAVVIVPDPAHGNMSGRYSTLHQLTPTWTQTGTSPVAGGTVALAPAPPQCSIAISWKTNKRRGTGANGRTYIPSAIPDTNTGTPHISTTIRTALVGAFAGLSAAIEGLFVAHAEGGLSPCKQIIATPGSTKTGEAGGNYQVSEWRIGSLIDTQRRRRNKFREVYTSYAHP